jgi:tripartite-type tricarboxylate transporter receptor subunit TctC
VPSLAAAAGLPGLDESATWIGLLAPAGTPATIVDRIEREVARIYADPAMQEKFDRAGILAVNSTAPEFRDFIRAETERWSKVIKDNPQIRPD